MKKIGALLILFILGSGFTSCGVVDTQLNETEICAYVKGLTADQKAQLQISAQVTGLLSMNTPAGIAQAQILAPVSLQRLVNDNPIYCGQFVGTGLSIKEIASVDSLQINLELADSSAPLSVSLSINDFSLNGTVQTSWNGTITSPNGRPLSFAEGTYGQSISYHGMFAFLNRLNELQNVGIASRDGQQQHDVRRARNVNLNEDHEESESVNSTTNSGSVAI